MTQKEILTGNKIIAEFMKVGFHQYSEFNEWSDFPYHKSWDWLMEVVQEVKGTDKIYEFNINWDDITHRTTCNIHPRRNNTFDPIYYSEKDGVTAVYKGVIKFIEWYNEQSK